MTSDKHRFSLSSAELALVLKAASADDHCSTVLQVGMQKREGGAIVELTRNDVELLRDVLTELLAHSGFESDYSLTLEGRVVEELIDKLFIPSSCESRESRNIHDKE